MMLSMNRSVFLALFFMCLSGMQLVAADDAAITCDRGPDALTSAFGNSIPQTCISVPSGDDGETSVERCFYTYVPESCSAGEIAKAPLVVDIHKAQDCALFQAFYSGWMQKAEEECIVVVWPNGRENDFVGSCFNVPGFLQGADLATTPCCCLDSGRLPSNEDDDSVYIKMVIDTTLESLANEDVSIDSDRIYMAGHSNGCMMSVAMAALYSDTITAVCCHAGAVITPFPEEYTPVPIWMVHGTDDPQIPYEGSPLMTVPGIGVIGFLSVDESMNILADVNGCSEEEETDLEDESGVIGTIYKKTNCKDSSAVEIVAMNGVDHFPYKDMPSSVTSYDTTALAWEFCSSYSKAVEEEPDVVETSPPEESEEPEEPVVEVEIDTESGEDAEESSAPTPKSFSIVLALSLFLGAVGAE